MGCKGATVSFIIHKSWTSLYLLFGFFTPKVGVLYGLLQGINSPCSFKLSVVGLNPFLTLGFSGYYFWSGNRCGSLSLILIGIALCAWPTVFPSAHILGFTFCSFNGDKEWAPYSWKQAWTLFSISLPKGVRETLAQSETHVKTVESQLQLRAQLK